MSNNYTERYEESYSSPEQKKLQKNKGKQKDGEKMMKKVTIDLGRSNRIDSVESGDSNEADLPVVKSSRDDVLQSLGYNPYKISKPTNSNSAITPHNLCHYCSRRVYPMEKIDVGKMYHKGCFKCHTCGLQLTLKTFQTVTQGNNSYNVFCKKHVPKLEASYDKEAMEIQNAIRVQKRASDKLQKQFEPSPNKYDPDAMEFEHARKLKKNHKVKRRKSLKTAEDFQKFGVFEAQEKLERKHREEEDVLYTEMCEERKNQLRKVEKELAVEKDKTVKDLIAWFEEQRTSDLEKSVGIKKVEQYYREQKESKVKYLLDKLHLEEQEAVARLTHKHAQEMLFMIEQKDKEVETNISKRESNYKRQNSDREVNLPVAKSHEVEEPIEEEGEDEEGNEDENENEDTDTDEDHRLEYEDTIMEETEDDDVRSSKSLQSSSSDGKKKDIVVGMREELYQGDDKDIIKLTLKEKEQQSDEELEKEKNNKIIKVNNNGDGGIRCGDIMVIRADYKAVEDLEKTKLKNKAVEKYEKEMKDTRKRDTFVKGDRKYEELEEDTVEENKKKNEISKAKKKQVAKSGEEDEVTSDLEMESVEDRIKRVLKKKNIELSNNTLDDEFANNSKGIAFERSSKSDTNIWKETNHARALREERRKSRRMNEDEDEDEDEDSPRLSKAPDAVPPMCRKSKLYKDPDVFKEFDKTAFEEAKNDPISFTDLVRKLTLKCKTDLQKVRSIFRWITAKDLNKMKFSESITSNTPMGLLRGIKTGTESYHILFKRLCSYVGIHCEIINGVSKGVGYKPGSRFRDSRFRNQWTAVWIKDSWRFINCNWGARHVKQLDDQQLTYKIDEFYFLTDPEDHIRQHFPDDAKWQLLRKAFTIDDFVRMPVVKSPFFNNKLKFESRYESILRASSHGYIEIKVRIPDLMSFAAKLEARDKSISSEALLNCCITRNVGNLVIFSATLPKPGKYYWDIYVDHNWKSTSLDNACSLMIYCSENPSYSYKTVSYPYASSFGKTPESEKYGLEIPEDHDPFFISKGDLEIPFNIPYQSGMKYTIGLSYHHPHKDNENVDCSNYSMIRCRTDSKLHCLLRLPYKGFYIFTLSAVEKASSKHHTPKIIYRCLIHSKVPSINSNILPYATSKWRDCWLVAPLDGELVMNTKVVFQIESCTAFEVVVTLNDEWFSLQKVDTNMWHGVVNTGVKPGKLGVFGRFGSKSDKYVSFLNYTIKEPSMKQEVNNLYKYI